jgi:hypothetical protein
MSEQRITVRITRDGEVFAETHGLKGKACLPYIAVLEDLLDSTAVDSEYTHEFHESAEARTAAEDLPRARLEATDG